ncbi:hypothetical protein ASG92_21630 [Arthrobacter sp. Soil736]|uniref:hypothetical protein n=1 Tax=Arthrobacter sp. Soil736 TaxID=1736395 RepID=UPI0007000AEA|nr:hypothetical protein [Arthrobacter sp. Soil736]KRE60553.1 hypothetical protein ASG92_21630 [Arthrobacter sp. Soil736]
MHVIIAGEPVSIDRSVFVDLLENSVVNGRAPYLHALEKSKIQYSDLLDLARKAEVPHPLFFAPPAVVQAQLRTKSEKLLQGVAPETFTVNTRTTVKLRDVELIVKDLLRKQELARKHDPTLVKNRIVGLLRKPRPTVNLSSSAWVYFWPDFLTEGPAQARQVLRLNPNSPAASGMLPRRSKAKKKSARSDDE